MGLYRKNIALAVMAVFLFLFSLGAATMHTNEMGDMSNCPWMGLSAICQMDIFEHISLLQNLFIGTPVKMIWLVLLSAFLIIYVAEVFKTSSPPIALKFFLKDNFHLPSFNPILVAIADGTVHPRLYA